MTLGAALFAIEFLACEPRAPGRLFVLVTIDTLRADRIGAFGHPGATSPAIDRLAAHGVTFLDARSVSSWTMPAMGTLATGLRPNEHGMQYWHMPLADGVPTIADLLAEAGVESAFFGNPIPRLEGLARGFEHWETFEGDDAAAVDAALAGLGDRRARRSDRLLWVHLLSPHAPYDPRPGTLRPAPGEPERTLAYEAEVRTVDLEVDRLLDALDADVPVLLTADHGETLDERGTDFEYDHGRFLWEELVRVPCIVRLPGVAPRLEREAARLADVPATICDWFGVTAPAPGYGRSWLSFLAAAAEDAPPRPSPRGPTFAFVVEDEPPLRRERRWSVRDGELKAVFEIDRERATLYDLDADPCETSDLSGARPAELDSLRRILEEWQAAAPTPRIPFAKRFTPEELERLQSLGYLGGAK